MNLLLDEDALERRRALARAALSPLADSLSADLEPLLGRPPYIPAEKAMLSKAGGRCESDGTDLEFDPMSPNAHRCPTCGRVHTGDYHDKWCHYPYQLWLAERAVHASVLGALRGDTRHLTLARDIVTGYADRYLAYPNRDNVLGPSRLFFSTYLESLWLLHICIATDALEGTGDHATADDVRERIVLPAVELIEEYDEGLSNRQVWNCAAIAAARLLLGEPVDSDSLVRAFAGTETQLMHAVGEDGSWYEGDNYHQFAHRGLWYAVALGERAGYEFDRESLERFEHGFAAPFLSALPDFTYPARKDSRYAASLRQWRFAESCELGLARRDDPVLSWALTRMYADDVAPGDTGRARSTGEAERHVAPVRLSRADLGWRSLLFANAELPSMNVEPPGSLTIASQGLTIHRREHGGVYVALDWGESGGGHGHPDRLNLLFSHGASRWLDDLGTGSYVDASLHWYRSTLAHNAPLVDGRSQARVNGECIGEGRAAGFEFVAARADGLAPGVGVERALLTGDGYFLDEVRWTAESDVRFELPIHFDAECDLAFSPRVLDGGHGLEDGFSQVRGGEVVEIAANTAVSLRAAGAQAVIWCDQAFQLFRATAPGQPASESRRFYVVRCEGTGGVIRSAWNWNAAPLLASFDDDAAIVEVAGVRHEHESDEPHWIVRLNGAEVARFARSAPEPDPEQDEGSIVDAARYLQTTRDLNVRPERDEWFADLAPSQQDEWATFDLGEGHYRRSEQSWRDAAEPQARVAVAADGSGIVVDVRVATEDPVFVPADAVNPFDNEHPDINGHGVQLYFASDELSGAWVLVPEGGSGAARVRQLDAWGSHPAPTVTWRAVAGGFELRAHIPCATDEPMLFGLDVVVNDAERGRVRRRGQLVMSGAEGEFVYLRGDRHSPSQLIPFSIE